MKSLRLLISFVVILTSPISGAEGITPEELYEKAKAAYVKPDCNMTLYYLDRYLKVDKPSDEKLASINSVKQWCKSFLSKGVYISTIHGYSGPSRSEEHVTEVGEEMLKSKPPIPNKAN